MAIASIFSLFQSFIPGSRLVDGGECLALANLSLSSKSGLVAFAGGGQTNATPMTAAINEFATVASANDSGMLPIGLPGLTVNVINDGAQSLQVYGVALNPNTGVGDTIAAHGSVNQTATATGVAVASGGAATFYCFAPGKWKQTLDT